MQCIDIRFRSCLRSTLKNRWKSIANASRFFNSTEERYRVNELIFRGIFWSIDHFESYLHGKQFIVITEQPAILSISTEHRSNKSYNSRWSRCFDRLIPYDFSIELVTRFKTELVDYIEKPTFSSSLGHFTIRQKKL